MRELMSLCLQRLEVEPPSLGYQDLITHAESDRASLEQCGVLLPTASATSLDCWECGSTYACPILLLAVEGTQSHNGYIHCPQCGIQQVDLRRTKRWSIDVPSLLSTIFSESLADTTAIKQVTDRLWRVGRIFLAGRSRDAYFTCCYRRHDGGQMIAEMSRRPKAILFAPTDTTVRRTGGSIEAQTVALDEALVWSNGSVALDVTYLDSRLADATGVGSVKRKPRKRASRAEKIESLQSEMIEHLRSARDQAHAATARGDVPQLLPRPTQRELGERCGLSETDVSRCLKDPTADYLRFVWATALELDQIMQWQTPAGNRPRS